MIAAMGAIFLRDIIWLTIRDQFTIDEVQWIKGAIRSRRCCPPGVYLELYGLDEAFAAKLRQLILGMR